uniref:Endoplasmic reticulum junction formation protein lunapark n=1 Tax=Hirondellea gigas TaxID=1518452 RepID=A0A2P2I3M1_9CRUS
MGIIFSWFRKPSTKQLLADIQEELNNIVDRQRDVEQSTRRIGRYVIYIFVVYLVVGLCTYWYWLPDTLHDWLKYSAPFAAFPPLVMAIKKFLHWYYGRQLRNSRGQVEKLKTRKREILDQVMETETYKIAKEILIEYAPEQLSPGFRSGVVVFPTPGAASATPSAGSVVRRRDTPAVRPQGVTPAPGVRNMHPSMPATPLTRPNIMVTPRPGAPRPPAFTPRPVTPAFTTPRPPAGGGGAPGPPMPRPVAPRDRGVMDRLIDYMMKEGPGNSFALVCRQCETHNGMALQEDFPYMAYRCAYCYHWNPARKQRPVPPRLEQLQQPPPPPAFEQDSTESSGTGSSAASSEDDEMMEHDGSSAEPPRHDETTNTKREDSSSAAAAAPAAAHADNGAAENVKCGLVNGTDIDNSTETAVRTEESIESTPPLQ